MTEIELPDGEALSKLLAARVTKSAKPGAVNEAELAERIGEIEIETETIGASFMKVHIIDPEWTLTNSGWLEVKNGLIEPIELEFPEKSKWIWTICAVEVSTDVTEPNLIVTFEDRVVAYLRSWWGTKPAPAGTQTRAQFIRSLIAEVGLRGEQKIFPGHFVCPSVNAKVPIETEEEAESKKTKTKTAAQEAREVGNKESGITTATAGITVKGQKPTTLQTQEANTLMKVAAKLGAKAPATEAILFAGIAESSLGGEAGAFVPNSKGFYGVLQGNDKTWPNPHDTEGMAESFMKGGKGFQGGGALALEHGGLTNPIEIAEKVEGGGSYAGETNFSEFLPEAKAIIAGKGGIKPSSPEETVSDVGQLERGTTANPDEDSWECCTRLAQQVNWYFFSNMENVFYMQKSDLMRQTPALYVDIPKNHVRRRTERSSEGEYGVILSPSTCNWDNTTFEYRQTHKFKPRVQRKSKQTRPASPSEVKLLLQCPITEFRAGDLFMFENSGPVDGPWIITDTKRNCLKDTHTEFILEPPIEPLPEPKSTGEGTTPVEATGPAAVNAEGYINPFGQVKSLTPLRVDQGVDYGGEGTIVALGDATVFYVGGAGWPGGGFVGLTLTSGAYKGKHIYHAENMTISVKQGQTVKAGQPIAKMTNAEPFTESGWASGNGEEPLAHQLNQQDPGSDPGGWTSAAGASFNRLLVSLGCVSGKLQSGGEHGKMPPGFP